MVAFFNGRLGQFEATRVEHNQGGHLSLCSLKFLRFSFALKNQLIFKCVRADFLRGRRPSAQMARRVGAPRPPFTFENQSEFFRKESTEMEKKGYRVGRSQCPPPLRVPQSPVYIRKKDAG